MNKPHSWILLTGFQPFGNYTHNPSGDIAHELHNTRTNNTISIHSLVLPVQYSNSFPLIQSAITTPHNQNQPQGSPPAAILLTGLAATITRPKLETQAQYPLQLAHTLESTHFTPSSTSFTPTNILPPKSNSLRLHTNINTTNLHEYLTQHAPQLPVYISTDAGTFVCNYLYYLTLQTYTNNTSHNIPTIFLHIPPHNITSSKHIIQHILNYLSNMST